MIKMKVTPDVPLSVTLDVSKSGTHKRNVIRRMIKDKVTETF